MNTDDPAEQPSSAQEDQPADMPSIPIEAYEQEFATVTPLYGNSEWADPVPFEDYNLPVFPVDCLPAAIAQFVEENAIATQTPLDLGAMLSLSAIAASTAKRAVGVVKTGYAEPLNLFTAVVLGPGERKSAVLQEILNPITDWDAKIAEETKPQVARSAQRFRLSEKKLMFLEGQILKAKTKVEREQAEAEAEEAALEHAQIRVFESPRLLADDCTQEALGSLLYAHGGRMTIMSAEGGVFSLLAGRYSDEPNLDVYLKAHSGDMLRVDRKGRPSEHVERPALTLGLAVQPGVIDKLADTPLFRTTGLLARFLYSMPFGRIGYRDIDPAPVLESTRSTYRATIQRMLEFSPKTPLELKLDTLAFQEWRAFAQWLEPQLREFETLGMVRDWGSKLPGAVVRIAGSFALINGKTEIDATTFKAACEIGKYLIPHAIAAFSAMGLDPAIEDTKAVLRLIKKKKFTRLTKKQLYDSLRGQGRFKTADLLDKPIELLVQRNYLRQEVAQTKNNSGGRPRETYLVNPATLVAR